MCTRFDSRKNHPNSKALVPKKKVLKEFQRLQEQIKNIHQEMIVPPGEAIGGISSFMEGTTKLGVSNRLFLLFLNVLFIFIRALRTPSIRAPTNQITPVLIQRNKTLCVVQPNGSDLLKLFKIQNEAEWPRQLIGSALFKRDRRM